MNAWERVLEIERQRGSCYRVFTSLAGKEIKTKIRVEFELTAMDE